MLHKAAPIGGGGGLIESQKCLLLMLLIVLLLEHHHFPFHGQHCRLVLVSDGSVLGSIWRDSSPVGIGSGNCGGGGGAALGDPRLGPYGWLGRGSAPSSSSLLHVYFFDRIELWFDPDPPKQRSRTRAPLFPKRKR